MSALVALCIFGATFALMWCFLPRLVCKASGHEWHSVVGGKRWCSLCDREETRCADGLWWPVKR